LADVYVHVYKGTMEHAELAGLRAGVKLPGLVKTGREAFLVR